MKQIIPFTKEIEFNNRIEEITSITIEDNLKVTTDESVMGDIIISGKYKNNLTTLTEEDFSYKIPVEITLDDKYITDNLEILIDDFEYSVDNNKLIVDVSVSLDNLEAKEEIVSRKMLTDEEINDIDKIINDTTKEDDLIPIEKEEVIEEKKEEKTEIKQELGSDIKEHKEEKNKTAVGSLFTAFKDTEDVFSTYKVYIMRENDNIEEVISRYQTKRELLEEYNDLSNIKVGSKIIIPSLKDENNK